MENLLMALGIALSAWIIVRAQGKIWKFIAILLFAVISYLILSAQAEYKRNLVIDYQGELIPLGELDRQDLSQKVQDILFKQPEKTVKTLDYNEDVDLNVTAIENQSQLS